MAGEGEEAAVRMAAVAGSAVVAGRMEDLAVVEEVRRRLLVADLMRVVEVLRVTAVAAVAAAAPAPAVDIGGIRSTAVLQLRQRLLKAACPPETLSRSRAQPGLRNILRLGTTLGWSRRAHLRARPHA
jgi:hypothetical protein